MQICTDLYLESTDPLSVLREYAVILHQRTAKMRRHPVHICTCLYACLFVRLMKKMIALRHELLVAVWLTKIPVVDCLYVNDCFYVLFYMVS